jgi:hypothetical protein
MCRAYRAGARCGSSTIASIGIARWRQQRQPVHHRPLAGDLRTPGSLDLGVKAVET